MTGQHKDRYVDSSSSRSSSRTEDNHGVVSAIMSSPIIPTTDEPILTASSNISSTTMPTVPVTKNNLVLHPPQHYYNPHHPHHHHQRQGSMYDPTKDLMNALPPEILDHVLFSLDRSTLLQCSVLSRRWSRRVMPHLWYRPWMMYYISWKMLVQTVSGARSGGSGGNGQEQQQQQRHGGLMRIVGSNPQSAVVGLGLTRQEEQGKQQDDEDKDEREDHAGREGGRGGIKAKASPNSREQGDATATTKTTTTTTTAPSPSTSTISPSLAPFTYGALIKILDFSNLHYILSDTFLSHLLPHTPSLQQLIIDSPKQFSDDSLFTLAEHCCNLHLNIAFCFEATDTGLVSLSKACPDLQDLDITGLTQVSDKSILAIGQRCMKFRQLVMVDERHRSNPGGSVGGGGGGGGGGGQWSSQGPLITDEVLSRFPWGVRVVQRRDELLGQRKSPRIF
ncbi:hypothetical protein BKA57DRAFT_101920 [Linnemannia elongata]|nr:hypothetical protein BKA57DRAFT_101920 [Linnemannia elongata]